jgi:tetratricopeptide (TPR) repeat protein
MSNGLEHLRKGQTLYFDLTREQPASDDLQLEFADSCTKVGNALKQRGDLGPALEQFRTARQICERLAVNNPQDQRYRRALWSNHDGIADSLFLQNELVDAIEENGKALALGEALIAENPNNADYRRHLVLNYKSGGDYSKHSDKTGALEYFRRAVALDEALVTADPANALTRKDLGYLHKRIADFLANDRDCAPALSHFSKARDIFEKLASDAPGDIISQFRVAACGAGVAGMQAQLGEVDPALEECRKAIALLDKISEETTNAHHRLNRAEAYEYLGYAYGALAASPKMSGSEATQWKQAREMFQKCLDILEDLRRRGALATANSVWAKKIAGEIAKCDTALSK